MLDVSWISSSAYDVPAINKHLHFIHISVNGFYGPWDPRKIIYLLVLSKSSIVNVNLLCYWDFWIETTGHSAPLRMPVNTSLIKPYHRISVVSTLNMTQNCVKFLPCEVIFLIFFLWIIITFFKLSCCTYKIQIFCFQSSAKAKTKV